MTDELDRPILPPDAPDADGGNEATDDADESEADKSPWLKEGADAPDAADIEDPEVQR